MRILISVLFTATVISACGSQNNPQTINEKQKSNYITSCELVMAKQPNTDPGSNTQFCKCTLEKLQTKVSAKSIDHLSYMFKKIENDDDEFETWVTAHPDAYNSFDKAANICAG